MKKSKAFLLVLMAIVLLAAMAVLPMAAGAWQDRVYLRKPSFGEIQNVELHFEESISGLGLLALMEHGRNWEIDASAASMTDQEALYIARNALETYQDAGLIDAGWVFEPYLIEAKTVSLPAGLAGIIWSLTLMAEMDGVYCGEVNLALDDATGRITFINFGREKPIPENDRAKMLGKFTQLFFEQLEITEYAQAAVEDLAGAYIGDDRVAAQRYRFGDVQYGELNVDFYVFRNGFYVTVKGGVDP